MENNKAWWEKESSNVSEFYEMKIGDNRCRLLSEPVKVMTLYKGIYPNSKYAGLVDESYQPTGDDKVSTTAWIWGIDRVTGELAIFQLGSAILLAITALKNSPEYSFSKFPMPYDINIKNTGEGANRYSIIAARQNTDVTEEEMTLLVKKQEKSDIQTIIARMKARQNEPKDNKDLENFSTDNYPKDDLGTIPF